LPSFRAEAGEEGTRQKLMKLIAGEEAEPPPPAKILKAA